MKHDPYPGQSHQLKSFGSNWLSDKSSLLDGCKMDLNQRKKGKHHKTTTTTLDDMQQCLLCCVVQSVPVLVIRLSVSNSETSLFVATMKRLTVWSGRVDMVCVCVCVF